MSAGRTTLSDAPEIPPDVRKAFGTTPEREADIEVFRRMLCEANLRTNLVGAASLGDFWRRHYLDSAQLLAYAPRALTWADLGSGAGLPGIVLAILLKDRPTARVHLVESRAKRCQFLTEVVNRLRIPAVVHHGRCEAIRLEVDVVTARACAPLDRLLTLAKPYVDLGAEALFLKGRGAGEEIREAAKSWRFGAKTFPSLSDPRGQVVKISDLCRGAR